MRPERELYLDTRAIVFIPFFPSMTYMTNDVSRHIPHKHKYVQLFTFHPSLFDFGIVMCDYIIFVG